MAGAVPAALTAAPTPWMVRAVPEDILPACANAVALAAAPERPKPAMLMGLASCSKTDLANRSTAAALAVPVPGGASISALSASSRILVTKPSGALAQSHAGVTTSTTFSAPSPMNFSTASGTIAPMARPAFSTMVGGLIGVNMTPSPMSVPSGSGTNSTGEGTSSSGPISGGGTPSSMLSSSSV